MARGSLTDSKFPAFLPDMPELRLGKEEFQAKVRSLVAPQDTQTTLPIRDLRVTVTDEEDEPTAGPSNSVPDMEEDELKPPFVKELDKDRNWKLPPLKEQSKMLTENKDVAFRESGQALVDLFQELETVISAKRLKEVLEKTWEDDADATLKIIWHARSIHLGKADRQTFYRAIGWLAENHPLTLLTNLQWLVRPLIQKKVPKTDTDKGDGANDSTFVTAQDVDSDFEMIDEDEPMRTDLKVEDDPELSEFDIKYGVAHGYWKDLLNILALAANDELKVTGKPRTVLNVAKIVKKRNRDWTAGRKKQTNHERQYRTVQKLMKDGFYKALHLTVARLFADQLRLDLARLRSGQKKHLKRISLAAKWAPTHEGMHDRHTIIVTTIAEMLHPFDSVCPADTDPVDRELYLKHARIAYQSQTLSPLRKHIDIVERWITKEQFQHIQYGRLPSLAMQQYTVLFAQKDYENFNEYLERVESGKAQISGATLLPSTMVNTVFGGGPTSGRKKAAIVQQKLQEIKLRALDGQWNTLVQRIKDSGKLDNSIAVCDVSGSMTGPRFPDGSDPMCSSIGLSLLLAEVTSGPFGGQFITFHSHPTLVRVGGPEDQRSFSQKVNFIRRAEWGGSTNVVAVFEKILLPYAVKYRVKPEEMVKQVFIFSDMQFNSATHTQAGEASPSSWTSSFDRIKDMYHNAGYDMPKLIFWNLAGGRAGYQGSTTYGTGDDAAPKPVSAAEENTALVSGYSQGQMKMFLDKGVFEDEEEVEGITEEEAVGEDGEVLVSKVKKTQVEPLNMVKKAIGHEAYRMLKVVD